MVGIPGIKGSKQNYPYSRFPSPLPKPPPPGLKDFATPSIYQSSPSYIDTPPANSSSPSTNFKPINNGNPLPNPYTIQQQTISPLTTSSTGQFGISANTNPLSAQQIQQTSTVAGTSAQQPATTTLASKSKAPTKRKKPSALDKYLGKDADYQSTIRDLARALTDFKARQNVEKARAGTEFGATQKSMGEQKDLDLRQILDDAAARGIATSGVYATRVGDYNTKFNDQLAELNRQYNNQLQDFTSALTDFNRQQSLQKEAARQAAIRRRAAQLGRVG